MNPANHPLRHGNETAHCDAMRVGIDSLLTWVVDLLLDDAGIQAWAVAAGVAVAETSGTRTAAIGAAFTVTETDIKNAVVAAAVSLPSGMLPDGVCWLDVLLVVVTLPFWLGRVIGAGPVGRIVPVAHWVLIEA